MGSPPITSDDFRGVVPGREFAACKCAGDEGRCSGSSCFSAPVVGSERLPDKRQRHVVAYLWHQDGTVSHVMCCMAAEVVRWTECHLVSLMIWYIPGKTNVLSDHLSHRDQVLPMEWSLLPSLGSLKNSTSLPPVPMPSFPNAYLWFWTRWLESRMRSNTLGTIGLPMPSQSLLCSGRSCQEYFFRLGSLWFWWCHCGHRKSGSPIFCPCWSTNHLHVRRCGTCWCSPTCVSSIEA